MSWTESPRARLAMKCFHGSGVVKPVRERIPSSTKKRETSPFLGMPASTPFGMLRMAARLGSVVLPSFSLRRGRSAEHDLYILPSPWEEGAPGPGESMEEAMTRCNDLVSGFIREHPEQWMWLYPRWASAGVV